jgi:polyhydroxybutyrate depolymerase
VLRRFPGQVVAVGAALAMGATMAVACGSTTPCTIGDGDYYAVLPEGLPKGGILFLHGWGGDARKEVAIAGTAGVVTARGYVFVAPVGLPYRPDEPVSNWNAELDPLNRDDVNFLRDVMDDAARRFEFPRSNVMVAGFSLGGMMVWRLACDAPWDYSAFASIAGTLWEPLPDDCAGPVRLAHFHGWNDQVVPLEGRPIPGTDIVQGDVFAALALVRRASGCTSNAPDTTSFDGVSLTRSWTRCASGSSIELNIHGGKHAIPPGWAVMTLDWFESSSLP